MACAVPEDIEEEPMDYIMVRLPRMQRTDYLHQGDVVGGRFEVDRKLGQGGYGQVFEAYDHVQKRSVAVKAFVGRHCYKIEMFYLKAFEDLDNIPSFISNGPHKSFHYITMDVVGPNLDLLNSTFHGLSKRTLIYLSLNILDALFELHEAGYIHGDIKPGNIAIGLPPDGMRKIYIYDFSLTKKIIPSGNPPAMFGTLTYAGIPRHRGQPVSIIDDYYSFLYTILDLKNTLPWSHILERNEVFASKTRYSDHICNKFHPNYLKFKKYLDNCTFFNPSKRMLKHFVVTAMQAEKFDFKEPFEWEMFPDRVWIKTPKKVRPLPKGFQEPGAEEEVPEVQEPGDENEAPEVQQTGGEDDVPKVEEQAGPSHAPSL